ncbi:MAG: nucleotidyltransferase, partial [Deltaproteobacteria bacterium]|nr:nucleotidyltransferase [Deltaproteobacteria bacterium]
SLLTKVARHLDRVCIPYMLIGGQAVLLYGEPRLTRDVDVTLGIDLEGLPDLLQVVPEMDLRVLVEDVEQFVGKTWVLPTLDPTTQMRVDFIFSWTDYERQAIARARVVDVEGFPVRFATAEDLIIHKIFSGRPRDLEDVRTILLKQDVDISEVERWLTAFSQSTGEDFLSLFQAVLKESQKE